MKIITGTINYQRNGIMGEPFYTVQFKDRETKEFLIAVVTSRKGGCHVINPEDTTLCYRGDNYECPLREEIIRWYAAKYSLSLVEAKDELNDGMIEEVY